MSWNIWVTAIYRNKKSKCREWKPVFRDGDDFTADGKHSILTEDPASGEIDIMEELDRFSVDRKDLPREILDRWGLLDKDGKPVQYIDVATIDLNDYAARCARAVDEYDRNECLVFKALGCSWHADPEWPGDIDYDAPEAEAKNRMTCPVNKNLMNDLNEMRPRFVKALRNLEMCSIVGTLMPNVDENGKYLDRDDFEIRLVMIAQ